MFVCLPRFLSVFQEQHTDDSGRHGSWYRRFDRRGDDRLNAPGAADAVSLDSKKEKKDKKDKTDKKAETELTPALPAAPPAPMLTPPVLPAAPPATMLPLTMLTMPPALPAALLYYERETQTDLDGPFIDMLMQFYQAKKFQKVPAADGK